jgi:hypothetical protein
VWIEGKIGDVSLFSMTTKEENNRRDDNGSGPAFKGSAGSVRKLRMRFRFRRQQISENEKF